MGECGFLYVLGVDSELLVNVYTCMKTFNVNTVYDCTVIINL